MRITNCSQGQKWLQVSLLLAILISSHPWLLRHGTFCCRRLHWCLQRGEPSQGAQHQQLHHERDWGGEGWDDQESTPCVGLVDAQHPLSSHACCTLFLCLWGGWWQQSRVLLLPGMLLNLCSPVHPCRHPYLHCLRYCLRLHSLPSEKDWKKSQFAYFQKVWARNLKFGIQIMKCKIWSKNGQKIHKMTRKISYL